VARILIAEDNRLVRWTLSTLLRSNGYEVDQATDGREAVHRFVARSFDAVLLDVHMPDMDGLEACRRMRQESKVPILMISTNDHPTIRQQALDCGANAFLRKPLDGKHLLASVRDLSEGQSGPITGPGGNPPPPLGSPLGSDTGDARLSFSGQWAYACALSFVAAIWEQTVHCARLLTSSPQMPRWATLSS
jgi:DNA-binding response OmpR family regulator